MVTRNVVITEHQSRMIEDLVSSGRYQNASEVLRAGLRLIEKDEARHAAELAALHAAAEVGSAEIERGEGIQFDDIRDLEAYLIRITDPVLGKRKRA